MDEDSDDIELVAKAKGGDRAALERLILRHQAWIYNIAVRMVYRTHDAEEVTQEVLVKVITKLNTFKGKSAFRTWLCRIVANHVLDMKQRTADMQSLSFATLGAAIDRTPDLDLPDPATVPVDLPLIVEEIKVACTTGMLLCLDRKQWLIFTLGQILSVNDRVGGEVLEMTADNFRQCLARACRDLHNFMNNQCGLVNRANPCRCAKKTRGFIEQGQVDPRHLAFVPLHVQRMREIAPTAVREIEDVVEGQHTDIYRDHPFLQTQVDLNGAAGSKLPLLQFNVLTFASKHLTQLESVHPYSTTADRTSRIAERQATLISKPAINRSSVASVSKSTASDRYDWKHQTRANSTSAATAIQPRTGRQPAKSLSSSGVIAM